MFQNGSDIYVYSHNNPINIIDPSGFQGIGSYIEMRRCECCGFATAFTEARSLESCGVDRDNNGRGNAFTHCVLACEITWTCTGSCALSYWNGREEDVYDPIRNPGGQRADRMDVDNNNVGIGCAAKGSRGDCRSCCGDKLKTGGLTCLTGPKHQKVLGPCPPPPPRWDPDCFSDLYIEMKE
jgi:hypothetical protein